MTKCFIDERVEIRTDFPCGNGSGIRFADGEYHVELEREPGEHAFGGKSYYFCVAVRNRQSHPQALTIRLQGAMDGQFGAGTREVVLRQCASPEALFPVDTSIAVAEWSHLDPSLIEAMPDHDAIRVTADLPEADSETPFLVLSNYHWHPYASLVPWLQCVADQPAASVTSCGRSAAGVELPCIEIGTPGAPCIVMAQTPQPSEMGTWACRAIVDYLLSPATEAAVMRQRYRFVILPETNPDGRAAGIGVSHPTGRMPYFEGTLTIEKPDEALPEMRAVWELLCRERPRHFVEWHSNHWDRRPGHVLLRIRPELLDDPEVRRHWQAIDEALLQLPDTYHGNWTGWDEGMYQCTLVFQSVVRLGVIAHMIKQHDKFPLPQSQAHAIACLRVLTNL